jgi:hypothetical protein
MPRLTGEPAVLHDEGAKFIAYHWRKQYLYWTPDLSEPVFPSEAEFAESLAAYVVSQFPAIRPGTEDFERVKRFARGECKIERVLIGKDAITDFLNTPAILELAPPRKTHRWTTSMVRNNIERGELPIASGGHLPWRCTTTALIDWFTDRNIRRVDELARLDPALREHIVEKRKHAKDVRNAQKLRDYTEKEGS